jgi:IclR family transcriptional regulator, KDG regulon repressor
VSQAARRALDLLEHIAWSNEPLGLTELSSRLGLDKSTAARLLKFLDERSLISRQPETKKYTIGPRLLALSATAMHRFDLIASVTPMLGALRDETDETACLHIRVANDRICVAGEESRHPLRRVLALGQPTPLWNGPGSKVILAFSHDADRVLKMAKRDGADVGRIDMQLRAVRKVGYMVAVGDRTPGVGALAVPVMGAAAGVVGSLTISGPAERWTVDRMRAFVPRAVEVATELSKVVGSPQW